jgi:GDP-L-fucose synthase
MTISKYSKIYVAGHKGMVGGALLRLLKIQGYKNVITSTRQQVDLKNQNMVSTFFENEKPDVVFLAAAKVGGIAANIAAPAEFIYENLAIQTHVIQASYEQGCKKFIFLGSSCIYPRECPQPMKEEYMMTGKVEPTNEMYAIAKIAGVKMCEAYRKQFDFDAVTIQPPNLYGEGDHFELDKSHVMAALFHRFYKAKKENVPFLEVWGTGKACRELMYVDDAAKACLFAMENNLGDNSFFNAGTNEDITIAKLAHTIKDIVGYEGEIRFDSTKPDGMPRKLMDSSLLNSKGWHNELSFDEGMQKMYAYFLETFAHKI